MQTGQLAECKTHALEIHSQQFLKISFNATDYLTLMFCHILSEYVHKLSSLRIDCITKNWFVC